MTTEYGETMRQLNLGSQEMRVKNWEMVISLDCY